MPLTSSISQVQPEYIIYSFMKDENSKGSPKWQASDSHEREEDALRKAKALFSSARFIRVEVRKKYVDQYGRVCDEAVRVMDAQPSRKPPIRMLLATAVLCAVVAGFITVFG